MKMDLCYRRINYAVAVLGVEQKIYRGKLPSVQRRSRVIIKTNEYKQNNKFYFIILKVIMPT